MNRSNIKNLDATAKRFLGSNPDTINIMSGQKVDNKKLIESQEKYLHAEACRFADILIHYIVGHRKLTIEQRTWSFALSLFCLRGDYPDGIDEFDELIDKGGNDLEFTQKNTLHDIQKIIEFMNQLSTFNKSMAKEAAKFSENITKYIEMKKHQMNLSNPQTVYGLGRAFHNLRIGFPLTNGGTNIFDELVSRANTYYNKFK